MVHTDESRQLPIFKQAPQLPRLHPAAQICRLVVLRVIVGGAQGNVLLRNGPHVPLGDPGRLTAAIDPLGAGDALFQAKGPGCLVTGPLGDAEKPPVFQPQAAQKRRQSRSVGDIAHDQVVIPDHPALRTAVQHAAVSLPQHQLVHIGAVPLVIHTDSPSFLSGVFSPLLYLSPGKMQTIFPGQNVVYWGKP